MGGTRFTQAEMNTMFELRASGLNVGEIAKRLGRSRSSIDRYVSRDPFSEGKTCADCAKPISDISASGRCRPCQRALHNRIPEMTAKRAEGRRRTMADPLKYARQCAIAAANVRKAMQNPEIRARFVEAGKRQAALYYPTLVAKLQDPEFRKAVGRKISATRLAWCPPEYREAYLALARSKAGTAAEVREMIFAQIRADRDRAIAALSPFERQDLALERGAKIVANDPRPSGNQVVRRFG
jgi:hypothetical protein